MSAQHTPGPWFVRRSLVAGSNYPNITSERRENIAAVTTWDDASLIAEAPAMLAELSRLAESFGWPADHPACVLIAKATGEQP